MAAAQVKIKTHSTVYSGGLEELSEEEGYFNFTKTWTVNPNTGLPWTWDEIDALQAGIMLHTDSEDYDARCTQVYVEVTYIPAGIARPLVGGSLAGNSLVGKGLAR